MTKKVLSLAFILLFAAAVFVYARTDNQFLVITWGGNTPEWNQKLHLSGVRIGCSDQPASCLKQVDQMAASQFISYVFLAILLNPDRVEADSAIYGNAADSHPSLMEVGFDDFVSQAEKSHLDPAALSRLLETVATNLKSRGSKVQLGITLYQDQLTGGALDHLQLNDGARHAIGFVHLFPHYRKERKSVADFVAQAKQEFPAAKVILGNYAYDRREYLPCSQDDHARCSPEEEISLFDQNLQAGLKLAHSREVAGIEFFPGNFGLEDSWKGWNSSRACKQGERSACVQNTLAMREKLRVDLTNTAP